MSLKSALIKVINAPEDNIFSSQTLYECLFYLIERENYEDGLVVAKLIAQSQLDDGGFDIGYDFLFGKGLTKTLPKEGTSPETLSITAVALFIKNFSEQLNSVDREDLINCVRKGLEWILLHSKVENGNLAIPYAPHSFKYVHITNATSFAMSAIAVGYDLVGDDLSQDLSKLYIGMSDFMEGELEASEKFGKYWPYFYQNGSAFEKQYINDKIDNYHIAQQLYFHILSQQFIKADSNQRVIEAVGSYILNEIDSDGFIPYTKRAGLATQKVDVWGFSSVLMAMAKMFEFTKDRRFLDASNRVENYLFNYCKANDYFYPIIDNATRQPFDDHFYPRSDAWVIHAVSVLDSIDGVERSRIDFCERVFNKIKNCSFRGLENHTFSFRKKLFVNALKILKK